MNELAVSPSVPPESCGRYLLYPAIAHGGMATVHPARLVGADGFTRLVAAKRLHPELSEDPEFVTMFHDEACIASRIHHPNVVPVLDVVMAGSELILVQEYVHGVPLSQLMRLASLGDAPIPTGIVIALLAGVLSGMHAAHEVRDEQDRPLEIVHRDVSPANVMVSVDGTPRLLDFGIAKARTSTHHTREGIFKGKLAYMAPEQLRMDRVDRRADVYAAGVLAWELLVNRRVYDGRHEIAFVTAVMNGEIPPLTEALAAKRESLGEERWRDILALTSIVSRAMATAVDERFATAEEMQRAILGAGAAATSMTVAEWVRDKGAEFLEQRQKVLAANEESSRRTSVYSAPPSSGTQRVANAAQLESGAYAVIRAPSAASRAVAAMRRSWILPWVASLALIGGGLIVGFLGGATEAPGAATPAAALVVPIATGPTLAHAPIAAPPAAPVASASPAASATGVLAPATVAPAVVAASPPRAAAPPPAAPRFYPVARSTPPTPAASATTATSPATASKSDCNPPFFFEGTKKIFKPSCL